MSKKENNFLLRGTLFGFLLGVGLWLILSILFIITSDFLTYIELIKRVFGTFSERGKPHYVFIFLLIPIFFLTLSGAILGLSYRQIKTKVKVYKLRTIGATIGLSVALFLKIFNDFAVRLITGNPIRFLPEHLKSLESVLFFLFTFIIGWLIGYSLEKQKKK